MGYTVGYVHATSDYPSSHTVQENLLKEYCMIHKINLHKLFVDSGGDTCFVETEGTRHILPQRRRGFYARRKMLQEIQKGEIDCILVDSVVRLKVNPYETQGLLEWCKRQNVTIIEVDLDNEGGEGCCRVAVYHYTNGSTVRGHIVEKEVDRLYEFVSSHSGWRLQGLYLDFTLVKTKQVQYEKMRENTDNYDVILTKDFSHIQLKTGTFWAQVIQILYGNVKIETLLDGSVEDFYDTSWFGKTLGVAIYYSSVHNETENKLRINVLKTFVSLKTLWSIKGLYIDCKEKYTDNQPELEHLLADAENYDLILVDDFGSIHFRTAKFVKIRKRLGKPIFSIKEGGILL